MFVSLGLKNAWRNRGRTVLGIVSMGVAAMIFMSSTTLGRGYPAQAFWEARQMISGEILMLPEKLSVSAESLAQGGHTWEFSRRSYDSPNSLLAFDPTPFWYGGLSGTPMEEGGTGRLGSVADELREQGFVENVSVKRAIPFLVYQEGDDSNPGTYMYGFIEPRDLYFDEDVYSIEITSGRYLTPDDDMGFLKTDGWRNLDVPKKATLQIPRADGDGYNWEDHITITLNEVGATRFKNPYPTGASFASPMILVTQSTFDAICTQAGIDPDAAGWGLSVSVDSMADLENYVALLRRQYPDFTVYSVSALSATSVSNKINSGVPMDMRRVTEILSFMIAALLSATNLSVLMLQRRNEIGILRALGATRMNIVAMVLTESIWLAVLGALLGSLVTQPAVLWQLLSNKTATELVVQTVLGNMGKLLGFSAAAAVLFGFLPVTKALRVTPAQVLRGE